MIKLALYFCFRVHFYHLFVRIFKLILYILIVVYFAHELLNIHVVSNLNVTTLKLQVVFYLYLFVQLKLLANKVKMKSKK